MASEKNRAAPGTPPRDRGASMVEHAAAVLLVATVLGALLAFGLPNLVSSKVSQAVCGIFDGRCGHGPAAAAGPAQPLPPGPAQPLPSPQLGPEPGPANPTQRRPPARPPTRPRQTPQQQTEGVLNETAMGTAALAWVRANGVPVVYRRGGGTHYDPRTNTIYVDTTEELFDRSAYFVHEVHHAQNRGRNNPRTMAREPYVNAELNEEVDGTVLAIQTNQQLQAVRRASRQRVPGAVTLQAQYEDAYNRAVQRENAARRRARRPALTAAEEGVVGQAAGRARVVQVFRSGGVVTSTTGQTYLEYYRGEWNRANPPPPRPPRRPRR